mmetsp:Transcript_134903/g.431102  ORF Transcript_134903/g.431102 Transcript_134903/m.431102 type:complete len:229 (+) Transcript_134903:156-842(+)
MKNILLGCRINIGSRALRLVIPSLDRWKCIELLDECDDLRVLCDQLRALDHLIRGQLLELRAQYEVCRGGFRSVGDPSGARGRQHILEEGEVSGHDRRLKRALDQLRALTLHPTQGLVVAKTVLVLGTEDRAHHVGSLVHKCVHLCRLHEIVRVQSTTAELPNVSGDRSTLHQGRGLPADLDDKCGNLAKCELATGLLLHELLTSQPHILELNACMIQREPHRICLAR